MAQKKTYRLLSLAVMAVVLTALLALSAVAADLSTGFGKILGDVSGYEAASVVLNSTGDGIADLDYFKLDKASNTGLAGLYYVRPEGSTENGDLIYVYGSYADRKQLYTTNEAGTVPVTTNSPDFIEGTWTLDGIGSARGSLNATTAIFHHEYLVTTAKTSKYWFLTNDRATFLTKIAGNPKKATLEKLADDTYYRNSDYYDVTTDGDVEIFTLNESGILARDELFNTIKGELESITHRYAYSPDDVIPVEEFKTIEFRTYVNTYGLEGTKYNNRNVTFYVIDKTGNVTPYTYSDGKTRTGLHGGNAMKSDLSSIENAPNTGWIIGIKIVPYGGVISLGEAGGEKWGSATTLASCLSRGNYRIQFTLSSYYPITIPVGVKPYGLTFDEMTVYGLDKNVTYNARPYTINGVDTESDPVVISGVEEYTFDAPGLWAISCATCDDYTESDYVLVYARGLASDRQKIGTYDSTDVNGKDNPKYTAESAWFPGQFSGSIAANHDKVSVDAYDLNQGTSNLQVVLNAQKALEDLKKAETPDTDAIAAAEKALADAKANRETAYETYNMCYAYASDEIILTNELESFSFGLLKSQNQSTGNKMKAKVVFYLVDEDGERHEAEWMNSSFVTFSTSIKKYTVDTKELFAAYKDMYVLGFRVYPWGEADFSEMVATGKYADNCAYYFYYGLNDYKIFVPKAAKPELDVVDDTVVVDLDDELVYHAYPVSINGVDKTVDPIVIDKVSEFDFATVDGAGLYNVYVAANGLEWTESDPELVYIKGDYKDRANILDVNANGANVWESSSEFVVGSLSTSYTIKGTSDSSNDYAQNDLVQAIYGSKYLATAPDSSDPTAVANMKTKFEKSAETISATFFKYAFDSDEIVPISEVVSYKWGLGVHYTQFRYTANISSKFVAYVMDDDGNIESYEYIHAAAPFTSNIELSDKYDNTNLMTSSKYVKTVDFTNKSSDFGEWQQLPTTGYFVGFEVLPLADMNNYSYVTHGGNVNSVNYFTIVVHNSKDNYVIAKPKYDAPEGLVVEGTTVSNLDDELTYVAYQVNVNGYDLENYVTISGVTEYTFADDEVGLWAIAIPGDENHAPSDAGAYVYNRALTSDLTKLGTFETETSTVPQGDTGSYPNVFVPGKFVTSSEFNGAVRDYMPAEGLASNSVSTTNSYQFHQVGVWLDVNDADVVALVEAKAAQNATAILQAQQNILEKLKKFSMTYAFMPDEVVPVRDMVSFKYGTRSAQGNFGYFQPSVIFYTIDSDGAKHDYTWNASSKKNAHYKQLVCNWTVDAVTALAEAGDDEVVVALEFMPYAALPVDQVSNWSGLSTTYNANQQVAHYFWFDSYDIKKPQVAAPTELELVGNNVTGLLEGVDYKYAPVTVNGVDYNAAADLTEDTTLGVGLWAVYYPENDEFAASLPAVFYIKAPYANRVNIGTFENNSNIPLVVSTKWEAGMFAVAGGSHLTENKTENKDTYFSFYDTALGIKTIVTNMNTDPSDANKKALLDNINKQYVAYQYAPDEIIPANELQQIKFRYYPIQGQLWYFKPSATFYLADKNANITEVTWYADSVSSTSYPTYTINVTSLLGDVTDKWVVGFELLPLGAADVSDVKLNTDMTNNNPQIKIHFYHSDYVISEDPATIDASLILDSKIGVKVQANFQDASITEATFDLGVDADEITVANGIATAIYYVAPKDVSAFELSGTVTAGDVVLNLTTTIDYLLGYYEANGSAELKALATALATYCKYAENYFADPDTVPALGDIELELIDVVVNEAPAKENEENLTAAGLAFKSTSLILEGATTIRHYFKVVDTDKFNAVTSHNLNEVNYATDIYYIDVENIAAHELNKNHSAVVTIDETTATIKFSAAKYVAIAFNSNDGRLVNLVKALYNYSAAADAYRAANPID